MTEQMEQIIVEMLKDAVSHMLFICSVQQQQDTFVPIAI